MFIALKKRVMPVIPLLERRKDLNYCLARTLYNQHPVSVTLWCIIMYLTRLSMARARAPSNLRSLIRTHEMFHGKVTFH